jgi:hypothetical protein
MQRSKLLIAIPACHSHNYEGLESAQRIVNNEAERQLSLRETWLKDIQVDYKFFYGRGSTPLKSDEIKIDIRDDYSSLPLKIQAACKYALENDYTHMFRTDNDSYVYVNRLLASGFEDHDYTGYCLDYPFHLDRFRYATGGAGFILSRKAMEIVAKNSPFHPAEDLWIGALLHQHGIRCHRDTRYLPAHDLHFIDLKQLPQEHPYMALHALTPETMRQLHARGPLPTETVMPVKPLFEPEFNFSYGTPDRNCPCPHCK